MITQQQIEEMDKLTGLTIQNTQKSRIDELRGLTQPKEKEGGFFKRVGAGFKEQGERIIESVETGAEKFTKKSQSGDVFGAAGSLLRTGLRTAGAVAEGAFTPIVEAPGIKQVFDFIGEKLGNSELGKQLATIVEKNPEKAQDVMDVVNILLLGAGKSVTKPVSESLGKGLTKTGEKLVESAGKKVATQKESFIRKLVRPVQTKTVREAQVARTTETGKGIFKKSIIEPSTIEARIEKSVATIQGVSEKNTAQKNFNIIKKANIEEAQNLERLVSENNFIISKKEIKSNLLKAKNELSESPLITGDAEKMAEKLINKANKIIEANEGSGKGLLKVRKEYDAWVKTQKPKAFDAKAENAFSLANDKIRDTLNKLLDEKIVNVETKASRLKQSNLYSALKNIEPKAAIEADTAVGRAFQNMANAVGIKNKIVQQVAAVAGIGGLGAAATFAPSAAIAGGLGFLVYKGGQLVLKPSVRRGLGELLKKAGSSINKSDMIILRGFLQQEGLQPEE